jgi:hypothetical protein
MKEEKVFIVLTHTNQAAKGSHPGRGKNGNVTWEVAERVEFVNHIKTRHITTGSAIGDYINRKMIKGERHGMADYDVFEGYVRKKYEKQMIELDAAYSDIRIEVKEEEPVKQPFVDQFGNEREKTVFDV